MSFADLRDRAAMIEMIILDVDGVMTDGRSYLNSDGVEAKGFDLRDGFGIVMARRAGITIGIITGVKSSLIEIRAKQLGIEELHQSFTDKDIVYKEIIKRLGFNSNQVAYIGDDLYDIPVINLVGVSGAPRDAMPEVINAVDWVSTHNGGRGAVREFIEMIMKAKGIWEIEARKYTKEKD